MSCVRIFRDNFTDLDFLANSDKSSEDSQFPLTNLFDEQRRSRVWRSAGFWTVASGSNTIVFRETAAGPDLTATVTAGDYSGFAAFKAALESALNAAGASTYTVTQSSTTLRFVITSDGAGGAGDFSLLWTSATAVGDLMGFDTTVDRTGALSYEAESIRLHDPNEYILFDFGIPSNPNSFALIGPRNKPISFSGTASVILEGNETDNFSSPSFTETLTLDDEVLSKITTTGSFHTSPLRFWRIKMDDKQNPNGYLELGSVFLGNYYETAQGKAQFPFQIAKIDRSITATSEGGATFSDERPKTQGFSIQWRLLTKQDREDFDTIFEEFFGTHTPFFIAIDPDAAFSTNFRRFVKFVKFESEPIFTLIRPNLFDMTMVLREEI